MDGNSLPTASRPRKRFVGRQTAGPSKTGAPIVSNQIPQDILEDNALNMAISQLPSNYSFEIHKTIHQIRKNNSKVVSLQMPEGLQMFACTIVDIIESFTTAQAIVLGDVTYGACCIDDFTAISLGCDMLIHYGHSCLVPIDTVTIKTLYIFVEISIDSRHLAETVRMNLPASRSVFKEQLSQLDEFGQLPSGSILQSHSYLRIGDGIEKDTSEGSYDSRGEPTRLALVSTIQFAAALHTLRSDLSIESPTGGYEVMVPRSRPLSPGEILGCTAPILTDVDAILYLGDGRFHLESIMIANPSLPAFRYDPYAKKITREHYDHQEMQRVRRAAVQSAKESTIASSTKSNHTLSDLNKDGRPAWGLVLGTLGRQGSLLQLRAIRHQLQSNISSLPVITILLSELSPAKLSLFSPHISVFVQTSCPRLSIDWGYAFEKPLLTPYETAVALGARRGWEEVGVYAMDFYEAGSPWAISRAKGSFQ